MISVSWSDPTLTDKRVVNAIDAPSSICAIAQEVMAKYQISRHELVGPRRARRVSWPRQEAMYRAFMETSMSLPAIGMYFGGRDHTTVLHAIERVKQRMGKSNG